MLGPLAIVGLVLTAPGLAMAQDGLALKRITLSSGGVGYFEYEASVDGDAEVSLPVQLDQVDDVLKSLVIRDPRGVAATLRLAGREPLSQIFRNLPIDQTSLASPSRLLDALKGSDVTVTGARTIRGRIVAVVAEKTRLGEGLGETTRHRVSIMTQTGIQHFILEESLSIQFTDPRITGAIEKGLAAIEENRARDKRVLHINSSGAGRRTLAAGYVVQAPVWKTTYRMTLPATATGGKARVRLEGWAIIENMSAQDWNGVELTLVSGNPVTFRQSLYAAYYVDRPEVPIAVIGRLLPRADRGAVAAVTGPSPREREESNLRQMVPRPDTRAGTMKSLSAAGIVGGGTGSGSAIAPAGRRNATVRDADTQVVFQLPRPVSVKTGHSLSVRFLNRDVEADSLSLFQSDTHGRHPLAAVRIRNDARSGLPPGALTFYEAGADGMPTYVGDAQLNALPVGESRILSYALDTKTTIDHEASNRQSILKGKISNGVLEITRLSRTVTRYRIKQAAAGERRLVIEHPRRTGWELVAPDRKRVSLTPRHFRIAHQMKSTATDTLDVILQRPHLRSYRLVSLSTADAVIYAGTEGFDPPIRKAFATLAALKRDIDDKLKTVNRLDATRKRWAEDQARLRSNLSKVPQNSDLHRNYLKRLSAHETKIESVMADIDGARLALDKAKSTLSDFIQNLKL